MPRIVTTERPISPKLSGADGRARPADGSRGSRVEDALFVGVVLAADGVRLVTAARSRRELVQRLADYAGARGDDVLRPDHARHLRGLILRGELEAAVELYFALVGRRWDEEWLVTTVVATDDATNVAAVVGEVALPEALRGPRRLRDAS